MRKLALFVGWLMLFGVAGCASATPTSAPTPTADAKPAQPLAPTTTPTTSFAVAANQPSATAFAPNIAPGSTLTRLPASTIPPITTAPGLYMSNLRIDPNPPTRGTDLTFFATFVNSTSTVQNYKWIVYIYRADTLNKSVTETTALNSAIPIGTSEQKGNGSWKVAVGGPCENFIARPAFFDQNNQPVNFTQPDGKVFEKNLTICAPVDLPTGSPSPTRTPTPTPTFAPGIYAEDLRTEPSLPTRGSDIIFYVTFYNTTGSPQDRKWNVYVFRPGESNAYGETTATTTVIANGINDYRTIGFWHAPINGLCEDFVVRVSYFDNENKSHPFTVFENQPFEKTISVCPP